jgi:hypothetical protein
MMTRRGPGSPVSGVAAWLALAALCLSAPADARHHIRYPALPADTAAVWHPKTYPPRPRIAYAGLPLDERIAPDDFAFDDDGDDDAPLSPAEAARLEAEYARRELGQTYTPDPAIWRIGDKDTTIYLFGTVHILPPGFRWRTDKIDWIVAHTQALLVESVEDEPGAAQLMNGAAPGAPKLLPLRERVSPDHRDTLQRFMDGLPPDADQVLNGLPTWIAAAAISYVRDYRAGDIPGQGADDWLEDAFRSAGKPVSAIEDSAKVIATVSAIPDAEQRRMLDAALDAPEVKVEELRAPLHAWAKGEIGPGSALTVDLPGASGTSALTAPLLTQRNRAWAAALAARLKRPGTILFAAGAGHFIGPDSLLDLLRAKGIKVKRVE